MMAVLPVASCGHHISVNRLLATDLYWLWTVHRCFDVLTYTWWICT